MSQAGQAAPAQNNQNQNKLLAKAGAIAVFSIFVLFLVTTNKELESDCNTQATSDGKCIGLTQQEADMMKKYANHPLFLAKK